MQATLLSCDGQEGHVFREIPQARQVANEPRRRWFVCDEMDLIVWYGAEGVLLGFELCYDKNRVEKSLAWKPDSGFRQMVVDDGERDRGLRYKATPVLVRAGRQVPAGLVEQFKERALYLPDEVQNLVVTRLIDFQAWAGTGQNQSEVAS